MLATHEKVYDCNVIHLTLCLIENYKINSLNILGIELNVKHYNHKLVHVLQAICKSINLDCTLKFSTLKLFNEIRVIIYLFEDYNSIHKSIVKLKSLLNKVINNT